MQWWEIMKTQFVSAETNIIGAWNKYLNGPDECSQEFYFLVIIGGTFLLMDLYTLAIFPVAVMLVVLHKARYLYGLGDSREKHQLLKGISS